MKFIKKCPLFILLLSSGLLLTILGVGGRGNVYATQEYQPLKAPILSVVFTGFNDNIYPWQIFGLEKDFIAASAQNPETDSEPVHNLETAVTDDSNQNNGANSGLAAATSSPEATSKPEATPTPTAAPTPTPTPTPQPNEKLEPLRESTHDEYMNHISADIYGDAGVLRAASYEFATVDESYFDDALFIGDSRIVGLHDYTNLAEHADFYCETSLTIYGVMDENFKGKGTIPNALANNEYGKIYIMVGINELGRGTTEDFMAQYTSVIQALHEQEQNALIFIQGIMHVSKAKNESDAIFNNSNIIARNHAIATLADNTQIFYIDGNEVICDEEGNLIEEYTFDNIHLLGVYNDLYKQYLLSHGVMPSE